VACGGSEPCATDTCVKKERAEFEEESEWKREGWNGKGERKRCVEGEGKGERKRVGKKSEG
jgi:hypothetical protein